MFNHVSDILQPSCDQNNPTKTSSKGVESRVLPTTHPKDDELGIFIHEGEANQKQRVAQTSDPSYQWSGGKRVTSSSPAYTMP